VNTLAATPPLIVAGTALLALLAGVLPSRWARREGPTVIAIVGLLAAAVMSILLWGNRIVALGGGYRIDRLGVLFNLIFIGCAIATLLLSVNESAGVDRRGEYAALVVTATAGMVLVAGAGDLITIFLGVEILSVALYVLCALELWRERSLESGLKYLIIGAVGSSFLLYGLTFLFGVTGSTNLSAIGSTLTEASFNTEPLLWVAVALIIVGLGFKSSSAPFHMWTPDVYEGAPTPITAFMATATKAAAFVAFLRIFAAPLIDIVHTWQIAIGLVAVASIAVGNIAALVQTNLKRMLAYSSVAQAGYLLIGVAAGTIQGAEAVLFYLLAYAVMTMAAFALVIIREREVEDGEQLMALAGYGRARPLLGAIMTLAMLSLAGFPPLSGFIGKFLLFEAAAEQHLWWLAVVGAVGSIVSLGYYLRVVGVLWFGTASGEEPRKTLEVTSPVMLTTAACGAAILGFAIFAGPLLNVCQQAAMSLLSA
jgi:NADH-quinone oxidoreductase subunit N